MHAYLFIHDSTALGGAEKNALKIISYVKSLGHPVYLLTAKKETLWKDFEKNVDGHLVTPFPYPRKLKSWIHILSFLYKTKKWMHSIATHWTIISIDSYSLWAALLLKNKNTIIKSIWQGEMVPHLIKKWNRYGAKRADSLWASFPIVKFIENQGGMDKPVHILNPYVNVETFNPNLFNKIESKTKLNFSLQSKIAICVGRIGEAKGQIWLAKSFLENTQLQNWHLLLVGPINEGRDKLQKLKLQDHNNRLHILENHQNIPELLAISDLAIFPGTCAESFGLSMIEALLMNLPTLVTAVGALPYLLKNYPGLIPVQQRDILLSIWASNDFSTLYPSKSLRSDLLTLLHHDTWQKAVSNLITHTST